MPDKQDRSLVMSLFRLLTDFDGRIGLSRFWFGSALVALMLLAIQHGAPHLAGRHAGPIIAFANAFALFPWAALAAKRSTDRGGTALFGILLVCAMVLPGQLKPFLTSYVWGPSLDTIALLAWLVALVDLGMLPSAHDDERVAEAAADAKARAWTKSSTRPSSPSTQPIPSP
jgi:uncharacterized membrane protein YhaH (DUF805 family)